MRSHPATAPIQSSVAGALIHQSRVVLAVSGGIDSMTMLDAALKTVPRDRLIVGTFDHGTGVAATEAAALVASVAAAHGVECFVERAATALTGEAQFRDARWTFLRGLAANRGASIATAHTLDDQIETVLMRLVRGAGARGLAGLYAPSAVVRPLLGQRRAEVDAYARDRQLRWVEDPTNAMPAYFRNRVRHDVLPALRRANPQIDDVLLNAASRSADWRRDIEALCSASGGVRQFDGGIRAPVALFGGDARAARLLWPAIASRIGVSLDRRGIERLAAFTAGSRVGARVPVSGGWEVTRGRNDLVLARMTSKATTQPFPLSDGTRVGGWTFRADAASATDLQCDPWSAWLPADAALVVRAWRAGDVMTIENGGTSRKVKHLLSTAGVTGHERMGWPVVVSGDDIVWIPGVRRGAAATARPGRPGLAFVCDYDNR